jgi:hypothetical protein
MHAVIKEVSLLHYREPPHSIQRDNQKGPTMGIIMNPIIGPINTLSDFYTR